MKTRLLFIYSLSILSFLANSYNENSVHSVLSSNDSQDVNPPFDYITLDNLLEISSISEDVWSSGYLRKYWGGGKNFDENISANGCLEQGWLETADCCAMVNVEKCGSYVFLDAMAYGDFYEFELNRVFTRLGKELLKHRVGREEDLTVYKLIKGSNTYQIKVDWGLRFVIITTIE